MVTFPLANPLQDSHDAFCLLVHQAGLPDRIFNALLPRRFGGRPIGEFGPKICEGRETMRVSRMLT